MKSIKIILACYLLLSLTVFYKKQVPITFRDVWFFTIILCCLFGALYLLREDRFEDEIRHYENKLLDLELQSIDLNTTIILQKRKIFQNEEPIIYHVTVEHPQANQSSMQDADIIGDELPEQTVEQLKHHYNTIPKTNKLKKILNKKL